MNVPSGPKNEIKEIRSRFLRLGVISADGKATFYDVSDPYHSPVKVLGPGEILVYEYSVNNVTDYTGTAFFNRAIINCDDYYASSIEVVTMSEMPTYITQDQFVKEHRDFVNSFAWAAADTTFPERISEGIKDSFEEDWYEFVEYGTTNPLTIFLQQMGYSREASTYIEQPANRSKYLDEYGDEIRIRKSILQCGNIGVETESEDIQFNMPELFID